MNHSYMSQGFMNRTDSGGVHQDPGTNACFSGNVFASPDSYFGHSSLVQNAQFSSQCGYYNNDCLFPQNDFTYQAGLQYGQSSVTASFQENAPFAYYQECPATSPSTTSLTPAEAGESNGAGETPVSRLDMFPDLQALELQGFPPDWLEAVASTVVVDLNKYGVCVIDSFLGHQRANQVRQEVLSLDAQGGFRAGQLVAGNHVQGQTRWHIRGDRVRWLSGNEPFAPHVGQLVKVVDTLVIKSNRHPLAGELAEHNVSLRTRAMVACYPGQGAQYVKHVDNPNGDGRLITAIYYVNKDWTEQDGGILEMYLKDRILPIKPLFDRMVFFWSDRRTPHAVRPSNLTRYAITVWYLDEKERDLFMAKVRSLCSAAS